MDPFENITKENLENTKTNRLGMPQRIYKNCSLINLHSDDPVFMELNDLYDYKYETYSFENGSVDKFNTTEEVNEFLKKISTE